MFRAKLREVPGHDHFSGIFLLPVWNLRKRTDDFLRYKNRRIFTIITIKISPCRYIGDHTHFFLRHQPTAFKTTIIALKVRTMTYVAAPPAVVMVITIAVVPRWRQPRSQMKALDLLYPSASRDWCRGAIKAFRLATLSGTTRIHRIRAAADKTVAKTTF